MRKVKRQLKKISRKAIFCLGLAVLAVVAAMGLKIAQAAWEEPISAAPGDNVYGMLNVGANDQTKTGKLLIDPTKNPYTPSTDLKLTYPLEVRGGLGANVSNNLNVVGNLIVDTNTLYVASNSVGIGTAADPAYKLSIVGGGTGLKVVASTTDSGVGIDIAGVSDTALFGQTSLAGKAGVYGVVTPGTAGMVRDASASQLAKAVAIDSTYMYVVGTDDNNNWRIEKRRLSDGALCTASACGAQFGTNGVVTADSLSNSAEGIAIDSTYIYVVGYDDNENWRIEKRRLSDGALCTAANCGTQFGTNGVVTVVTVGTPATTTHYAKTIAIDSTYMYVAGNDNNNDWHIEKRLLSDGSLVTAFDGDGIVTVTAGSIIEDISIDASYLYVVGDNGSDWRIQKFSLTTGASVLVPTVSSTTHEATAIAADSSYFYVVGNNDSSNWRIEKRDKTSGNLCTGADATHCSAVGQFGTNGVRTEADGYLAHGVAVDTANLYVVGNDDNGNWRLEEYSKTTGIPVVAFDGDGVVTGDSTTRQAYDVAIDTNYMYVVGNEGNEVNWHLEKRFLSSGALDTSFGDQGWGVAGQNNAAASTGSDPLKCMGVYGNSSASYGVYGKTSSTTNAAVYGEVSNPGNVTSWAGYFTGRLGASSEVAGNKFLPTTLQNSLMPYVSGMKIGDYTADTAPMNLVFDGTHIWTANTGVSWNTHVSEIRASDGMKIRDKNLTPALDVTFDGTYVWVSSNDGSNGKMYKFYANNPDALSGPYTIDKDANNIIATSDSGNIYVWTTSSSTGNVKKFDSSGNLVCPSGGLTNPQGMAFDGTYVWVVNGAPVSRNIIKIDSSCNKVGQPIAVANANKIIFDGTYLWVTSNAATGAVIKVDPVSGATITYPTGISNAYDLAFDGTYLWITHDVASGNQVAVMRASDGQVVNSFVASTVSKPRGIIFDGTYLWIGYDSGQIISKYYSGTGWGYPDLSAYLTLQYPSIYSQQSGSFHITGTATLGGNFTAGGNIDAPKNTWDDSADTIRFMGESCLQGQYAKGVTYDPKVKWRTPENVSQTKAAIYPQLSKYNEPSKFDVYNGPSMALDSNGYPHIAWVNKVGSQYDIYYLKWNGSEWVTAKGTPRAQALLDPVGSKLNVSNTSSANSSQPSLALYNDNAYIAFSEGNDDYTNNSINFMKWDNTKGWTTITGDGNNLTVDQGRYPSLAVDSSGNPYVAYSYLAGSNFEIYYRHWKTGSGWVSVTNNSNNLNVSNTNGVDSTLPRLVMGNETPALPHIVWFEKTDADYGSAYYRWWDPTANGNAGGWVDVDPADGNYNDDVKVNDNVGSILAPSEPPDFDHSEVPNLALFSNNKPGIVWNDPIHVFFRRWDATVQRKVCSNDSTRSCDVNNPCSGGTCTVNTVGAWVSMSDQRDSTNLTINVETGGPPVPPYHYSSSPHRAVVKIFNDGGVEKPYVAWSEWLFDPTPDPDNGLREIKFRRWNPTQSTWETISGSSGSGNGDQYLSVSQSPNLDSGALDLAISSGGTASVAWAEKTYQSTSNWCDSDADCPSDYPLCVAYTWSSVKDYLRCAQVDIYYNRSGTNELLCRPL